MADLLGLGVSGLLSYQRALTTTSHNVTNVNTPGYSRQRVEMESTTPQFLGGNFLGSGVQVDAVRRIYDEFLVEQVRSTSSLQQQHETMFDLSSQIDNLLADPAAGLTPVMQNFFNALQDLASDPASTPARQVVLSEGESLTARFNDLFGRLDGLREGANSRLDTLVIEVNALSQAIADVNEDILNVRTGNDAQQPNDLLDRRDHLVDELSKYVSVRTLEQDDGTLNVFIGSGQSLVVGISANSLESLPDPFDPTRLLVGISNGTSTVDITGQLSGGRIGGVLEFRDQVLDPAMNGLGRVALSLVESFNTQHSLGQDLDGDLGGNFFSTSAPEVLPNNNNGGTGQLAVSISDLSAVTTSNYELRRNGADYELLRLSDGIVIDLDAAGFPGATVTVDGLDIALASGAIADGDRFLLRPVRTAADAIDMAISHTNDIAAAAPMRTAVSSANTGTGLISAGSVNAPLDANVRQTVTLTFNNPPTTFDVNGTGTGNPTGVAYTSGGDITYNGWTIQIEGTPAVGDTFTVEANTRGVGDNRNALQLAVLQNAQTLDGGTTTLVDAYGSVVAELGTRTRQADLGNEAQSALLEQSIAAKASVSGVNLDEEAANLVRFQQAYQAAAQLITVADTLFQTLLGAVRR